MPAVIPIIAAFASGAVGAVVAGTASFAAYASVAGAVMSTVGALTGSKDLSKVGSILSLGGGIANFASGASGAASSASGIDAATTSGDYVNAMDAASDAASATNGASAATGMGANAGADAAMSAAAATGPSALPNTPMPSTAGALASPSGMALPNSLNANIGMASANAGAASSGVDPMALTTAMPGSGDGSGSLMNAASNGAVASATSIQPLAGSADKAAMAATNGYGQDANTAGLAGGDKLSTAGQSLSWKDIQSFYDKAAQAVSGAGQWAQKNPVLANLGMNAISGAYGPQAQQLDYQKSLMERARQNLNSPVRINYNKGG